MPEFAMSAALLEQVVDHSGKPTFIPTAASVIPQASS